MNEQRFPRGWDEQRVKQLIAELDAQQTRSGLRPMRRRLSLPPTKLSLLYLLSCCLRFAVYSPHTRRPN